MTLQICFRAASTEQQLADFSSYLQKLPDKVSDLLDVYGTEQVVFTFPRPESNFIDLYEQGERSAINW
ncbi:MAG: hypothetical protein AB7S38_30100 [Vulcanimicrobiota bacterium]